MNKSEVVRRLVDGSIAIHYDVSNLKLLRELFGLAFPKDNCLADGISLYYEGSKCNGLWRSTNSRKSVISLEIIKLSEITEGEFFEKGEMVEVRDYDKDVWNTREFVAEHKGDYICVNASNNNIPSSWKQIRKVNPLQAEIDALKASAEKQGITVNIEIKY